MQLCLVRKSEPYLPYAVGAALNTPFYQVLPLLAPNLDLETLVSLCQASKQLHDQCLDLPDQLLQSIVQQALKQKEPKLLLHSIQDPNSCCSSLAWLLGALSKQWGIVQLAARLDLQQALLAAEGDSVACYILICAGARVTRALICSSGSNMGPKAWANAYDHLSLSWSLPPLLTQLLMGVEELITNPELPAVDSQLLFELVSASLKICDNDAVHLLLFPALRPQREAWLPEQVLDLALLAAEQSEVLSLCSMLSTLPAAQQIGAQGYAQLLLLLFSSQYRHSFDEAADLVLPHVQWGQQLVGQIKAAVGLQPSQCQPGLGCTVCTLLRKAAQSAAALPIQLQIGLLEAATSARSRGATELLDVVASSRDITEMSDGIAAVQAGLHCWVKAPVYESYFKQLLQQPAVQQLPLAEVQQLLLQAVRSSCTEGLDCLIRGLPTAQEVTGEGLQQLLGEAIEHGSSPVDDPTCCSWLLVYVLVTGRMRVLGPGQLQPLMIKCFKHDEEKALLCLMEGLPADARQLQPPAVFELMRQAVAAKAPGCFLMLRKLVRQLGDVPLDIVKQVLPMLMVSSCSRQGLTPAAVVDDDTYLGGSCLVCAVLKAVAGKLAAADVWEVLVAAAREPVPYLHMEGLACLPGVDELGDQKVEQLLMAAIEALPVGEWEEEQLLLNKLEQLQEELLFNKQLPAAAVHRLMVACVGKAVEGGVGRLREELGLQGEGWEGGLSPEDVKQLMGIAVRCSKSGWSSGWVAGGRIIECRPCLLVLAKLLPTLAAKQLVEEGLRTERMELMRLGYDSDDSRSGFSASEAEYDSECESGKADDYVSGSEPDSAMEA